MVDLEALEKHILPRKTNKIPKMVEFMRNYSADDETIRRAMIYGPTVICSTPVSKHTEEMYHWPSQFDIETQS